MNHLRPDLKRGRFTPTEISRVVELHNALGNRWSEIASHLVGRTDNDVKNLWNTQIKRQFKFQQRSSTIHMAKSATKSTSVETHNAPSHGHVHVEPSQYVKQHTHLNATTIMATKDTLCTNSSRCKLSVASDHTKIESPTTIANDQCSIALQQENSSCKESMEYIQHKEEIKLQKMSKNSISIKSIFTLPFNSSISPPFDAPPPPFDQHFIEKLHPINEGLVLDDSMRKGAQTYGTSIDIPHAFSSSNLRELPTVHPNEKLAYTTLPKDIHRKSSPLCVDVDDMLQPEVVEAHSTNSCSSSINASFTTTIPSRKISTIAHDNNIPTSFASSTSPLKRGLTQLSPIVFSLQPTTHCGQPRCTTILYKETEQHEPQQLPNILASSQGRSTSLMCSRIGIEDQQIQHDSSCGINNDNVVIIDSDGTTNMNTNGSSKAEDVSLCIDATGGSYSTTLNWWLSTMDVDFFMLDSQLLDIE